MSEVFRQACIGENGENTFEKCERIGKVRDMNLDCLLDLADSLLNRGKIHEALNAYCEIYAQTRPEPSRLSKLVDTIISIARQNVSKQTKNNQSDFSSCILCQGILINPITLSCGHTFCKKCIIGDFQFSTCKKCGNSCSFLPLSEIKTNVTMSTLLEKLLEEEVKAAKHGTVCNQQFQGGNSTEAIENYSLAVGFSPFQHLAASSYSHVLSTAGESTTSITDVNTAVHLCSTWHEGHFRQAISLVNFGRYEDAIISYLQCQVFDDHTTSAKDEVIKLIHNLLLKDNSFSICYPKHKSSVPNFFNAKSLEQQRELTGSDGSLYSGDSSDGIWVAGDNDSSGDEDALKSWVSMERKYGSDHCAIHSIIDRFFSEVVQHKDVWCLAKEKMDTNLIDKFDFECPLCMRLFWEPVTTPCGHTFCRMCLDRCFDHQPNCPLCKTTLSHYLAERKQCITECIEMAILSLLPKDYAERKAIYEEEMEELASAGKDSEHVIPLFVCTMAYPTVPCPLHVFEPRYRLMIRQCMESGSRQFGMCAVMPQYEHSIVDYGTMLEIRDVQYFPDGRSVVDTVGNRRFRILSKGMRDGYHTGAVEFLQDEITEGLELDETRLMHDNVRKYAESWLSLLPKQTQQRIEDHFGLMPAVEDDYLTLQNGPAWTWWLLAVLPLDTKTQLGVLAMTSFHRRLEALQRVLLYLHSNNAM